MALRRSMPIRDQEPRDGRKPDEYQASRGCWYPAPEKPVPGKPKQ